MSTNFTFRPITGYYRGSIGNQLSDYIKISNMFLEISGDISNFDSRIAALEANLRQTVTNDNFELGSINGAVITNNSLPGSAIENNSIDGSKIVTNSINGIKNENIASDANINPSKIDLSNLSHTQIKDIGSNTHPQIDAQLGQLWGDTGLTNGVPAGTSLLTLINGNSSALSALATNLSNISSFVGSTPLATSSQVLSGAVNELFSSFQTISASGTTIVGPISITPNDVVIWGADNTHVADSPVSINPITGTVTIPGNIQFTTTGNQIIAASGSDLSVITNGNNAFNIVTTSGNYVFNGNIFSIPANTSISGPDCQGGFTGNSLSWSSNLAGQGGLFDAGNTKLRFDTNSVDFQVGPNHIVYSDDNMAFSITNTGINWNDSLGASISIGDNGLEYFTPNNDVDFIVNTNQLSYNSDTNNVVFSTFASYMDFPVDMEFRNGGVSASGNLTLTTAGNALVIAEGTGQASVGCDLMVSGVATISNSLVASNTRIFPAGQENTVTGALRISSRNPGSDFTITSSDPAASGLVAWHFIIPA